MRGLLILEESNSTEWYWGLSSSWKQLEEVMRITGILGTEIGW